MFADLCKRTSVKTSICTLKAKKDNMHYRLEYSPVGNDLDNPIVILSGITASYDSWQIFLNAIRNNAFVEKAARESIFSNMRKNMFNCLDEIGLFKYLSSVNEYWATGTSEVLWDMIFTNENATKACGIQTTQACNCAMLRGTRNSEQPSQAALNEISRNEPKCFFNRFHIGPSTKLIVFWGMSRRLDNYWKESCYYNPRIKTLVLPHPSGSNRVFNNYDLFKPYNENDSTQLKNAKASIKNGKRIINELI